MPHFNPIKLRLYTVGDLVAIVIGESKYVHGSGTHAWLECHVAEVFSVGEYGRIKSVRFAVDGAVVRRKDLHRLVSLNPFPANEIDVPGAMAAAKAYGKPFETLDAMRAVLRPFVLVDLTKRGYPAETPVCPCGCSGGPDDCTCGMRCICSECVYCDAVVRAASPLSSTPLAVAFGAAIPAQRDGEQADGGAL